MFTYAEWKAFVTQVISGKWCKVLPKSWPRKDCYNNYLLLIGNSEHLFELAQARLQQGLRLCIIDVAGRENRLDTCLIEMKGLIPIEEVGSPPSEA